MRLDPVFVTIRYRSDIPDMEGHRGPSLERTETKIVLGQMRGTLAPSFVHRQSPADRPAPPNPRPSRRKPQQNAKLIQTEYAPSPRLWTK